MFDPDMSGPDVENDLPVTGTAKIACLDLEAIVLCQHQSGLLISAGYIAAGGFGRIKARPIRAAIPVIGRKHVAAPEHLDPVLAGTCSGGSNIT